jgi:hypothetical protein
MSFRSTLALAVALLAGSATAADVLKSGPQVGEGVPGGFPALFVNGLHAGQKCCPV